jgi:hypothetical protein
MHFLNHTRKYNTAFQMASLVCKKRDIEGNYMPTLKVQSQVYHWIGSLPLRPASRYSFCRCISWGIVLKKTEEEEP